MNNKMVAAFCILQVTCLYSAEGKTIQTSTVVVTPQSDVKYADDIFSESAVLLAPSPQSHVSGDEIKSAPSLSAQGVFSSVKRRVNKVVQGVKNRAIVFIDRRTVQSSEEHIIQCSTDIIRLIEAVQELQNKLIQQEMNSSKETGLISPEYKQWLLNYMQRINANLPELKQLKDTFFSSNLCTKAWVLYKECTAIDSFIANTALDGDIYSYFLIQTQRSSWHHRLYDREDWMSEEEIKKIWDACCSVDKKIRTTINHILGKTIDWRFADSEVADEPDLTFLYKDGVVGQFYDHDKIEIIM